MSSNGSDEASLAQALESFGIMPATAGDLQAQGANVGFCTGSQEFLYDLLKTVFMAGQAQRGQESSDNTIETMPIAKAAELLITSGAYLHTVRFYSDKNQRGYKYGVQNGGSAMAGEQLTETRFLHDPEIDLIHNVKEHLNIITEIGTGRALLFEIISKEPGQLRHFALATANMSKHKASRRSLLYVVSMYDGEMADRVANEPQILLEAFYILEASGPFTERDFCVGKNLKLVGYKNMEIQTSAE